MEFLLALFIFGLGITALRSALLNKRPKLPNKFGFHKKVNWDNHGRLLTGLSGLVFIFIGGAALFVFTCEALGVSSLQEFLFLLW